MSTNTTTTVCLHAPSATPTSAPTALPTPAPTPSGVPVRARCAAEQWVGQAVPTHEMISLGSYVIGCLLLCGLFVYDVFWVFGTGVRLCAGEARRSSTLLVSR